MGATTLFWASTALVGVVLLPGCGAEGVGAEPGTGGDHVSPGTAHPDVWPQGESPLPPNPELDEEVEALLARLTVAEKVGQVLQPEIQNVTPEDVRRYRFGSVLVGGNGGPGNDDYAPPKDWLALADDLWDASMEASDDRKPIPLIWGIDSVHGHANIVGATIFPHNVALGATRNPKLARRIGEITAVEMAVTGLDWHFGPTVAVARDGRWGRAYESFSESPALVAELGAAMVVGIQGTVGSDEFLDPSHVLATAKHFVGDGGTDGGTDQGDTLADEVELRDVHGAGYVTTLAAGVQTVMASYSSWQGRKLHGHRGLLTDVLKGRMGFDGFVIGDYNGHGQLPGCTNGDCPDAFNAGVDMYMVPEDWKALYENTLKHVESGRIPMERLDDAVRRILRVKMRLGLFTRGRPSARRLAGEFDLLGAPEHRAAARQAVRESLVLLKNDGGLLPLHRDARVLVAGDGADDIGKQSGGWTITWQGTGNSNDDFPGATSIWTGIREAVESGGGEAILRPHGAFEDEERPDVAVVVFGEDPYAEFLGDRDDLEYRLGKESDLALLERLRDQEIPVVSIFLSGRPLWVHPELNASRAFVAAWLPGTEGGGIADVIFRGPDGQVHHDFVGKLPFSWPRTPSQAVLNPGDPGYDPLFPFGFGLTYGDRDELGELPVATGPVTSGASRKVYFSGGVPVGPWKLYAGDASNWSVPVAGSGATALESQSLSVGSAEHRGRDDAVSVRWSGKHVAQVYLQASQAVDVHRESNGNVALGFDVFLEEPPTAPVTLRMDCKYPCSGALDVTDLLHGLEPGAWHSIRLRLRCFEDAGADMTRINTPFLLSTSGKMALRFADVKLVSAPDAVCP